MADLEAHTNYTAAYSGLLDNLYLTLAIAGACLLGHEIEVHIPRRRGKDGPFLRIPVRIYHGLRRALSSRTVDKAVGATADSRRRLGERESWEFGYIYQPKAWAVNASPRVPRWPLMWIVSALKVREKDMPAKCGLDLTLHARFLRGAFFYTLLQTLVIMPILMPLHIIYSPSDIAKTSMLRASVSSLVESSGSKWLWVHAVLIWWISITWTATVLWITWGALAYRRRDINALAATVGAARSAKRAETRGEDDRTTEDGSEGIKRFRTLMVTNVPPDMRDENALREYFDFYIQRHRARREQTAKRKVISSDVDDVVLVRKLATLSSLRSRRQDVLRKLEIAHVILAKRVVTAVSRHKSGHLDKGADDEQLAKLAEAIDEGDGTIWDALHAVPREYLDRYQSLTHRTSMFRDTNAPIIDYLTTKLNYLTMLLTEAQSRPLSSYPTSSTAFVTFRDARTARLALKILDSHPNRALACHATPAPDWTDLLWPRLSKSVYRSEFVRGWVIYLGVWAFTLIWIFPVSLLCALASLSNIAGFIKPLENFLTAHPKAASAITSLAPVILVALLTLAICPILLVIANKAETIVTRLGIHNSVLERFWKFLMINGVVFFAIGQSAIEAYLTAFQTKDFDPLPVVASAFSTAAPYFASYILLQVAIQPFFEIFRFGLPTIVYVFGTRRSVVPRQRSTRTAHPTFSHFSQVPQQLLAGAIMHLFMLLNPLVIPFTLIYYGACYTVWKRQFTYVYGRLYETNGRRSSIRILRYSLDALALAQFVLFAFFILNKAKGHAIATGVLFFVTLIVKIIITLALKKRFNSFDVEEADILCPPDPSTGSVVEETAEEFDLIEKSNDDEEPHKKRISFRLWHGLHLIRKTRQLLDSLPFDRFLFATLDTKIFFDPNTNGGLSGQQPSQSDSVKEMVKGTVVPHPPLQPWEDIPPYQRSRGYNDQPAYTDEYDDFLWLPRDPLSTLDLDDTVEMRLSLTTSNFGLGHISDNPLGFIGASEECADGQQEILNEKASAHVSLPTPHDGNSLEGMPSQRRRATTTLDALFRRPRTSSTRSDNDILLQPLSAQSSNATNATPTFTDLVRTSTPRPISELGDSSSDPPQEPRTASSHISFSTTLGRSPSGRRPSRLLPHNEVLRSPSVSRDRALSAVSTQTTRTLSGLSSQQHALLSEVMEEERLANSTAEQEVRAEQEKEQDEVAKEQEKRRKTSESGLRRRLTRGDSERPGLDRANDSQRSRRSERET